MGPVRRRQKMLAFALTQVGSLLVLLSLLEPAWLLAPPEARAARVNKQAAECIEPRPSPIGTTFAFPYIGNIYIYIYTLIMTVHNNT